MTQREDAISVSGTTIDYPLWDQYWKMLNICNEFILLPVRQHELIRYVQTGVTLLAFWWCNRTASCTSNIKETTGLARKAPHICVNNKWGIANEDMIYLKWEVIKTLAQGTLRLHHITKTRLNQLKEHDALQYVIGSARLWPERQ